MVSHAAFLAAWRNFLIFAAGFWLGGFCGLGAQRDLDSRVDRCQAAVHLLTEEESCPDSLSVACESYCTLRKEFQAAECSTAVRTLTLGYCDYAVPSLCRAICPAPALAPGNPPPPSPSTDRRRITVVLGPGRAG